MAIYHIVPLCLITHEPQGASRPEHARCESPAGGASLLVLGPCQTGAASLATRKNLPSSFPLPPPKTKNRGGFGKIIDLGTIGYADSKKKRHDKQQNKSICCLSCHSKGPSELFETQVSFPSPLFCHERSLFWFSPAIWVLRAAFAAADERPMLCAGYSRRCPACWCRCSRAFLRARSRCLVSARCQDSFPAGWQALR